MGGSPRDRSPIWVNFSPRAFIRVQDDAKGARRTPIFVRFPREDSSDAKFFLDYQISQVRKHGHGIFRASCTVSVDMRPRCQGGLGYFFFRSLLSKDLSTSAEFFAKNGLHMVLIKNVQKIER